MQFKGFDWLSGDGFLATIPFPSVFWLFLQNEINKILQYFLIVFNRTIIPLTRVGYEMIQIANLVLRTSLVL